MCFQLNKPLLINTAGEAETSKHARPSHDTTTTTSQWQHTHQSKKKRTVNFYLFD